MGKKVFAIVCVLAAASVFAAQPPFEFSNFFPEADEINASSRSFVLGFEGEDGRLARVSGGRFVSDVGFMRYERADYTGASPLSIEVFTLLDSRAAYSLLTLLSENPVSPGPPGDAFTSGGGVLLFAQSRIFVRITWNGAGIDAPEGMLEKAADAVSLKVMPSLGGHPGLLDYLPPGYGASSLRYFPSQGAFDTYKNWTEGKVPEFIDTGYDMEIATARYFTGDHSGTVFLMRFPNPELAEDFYQKVTLSAPAVPAGVSIYARTAGPLVAILEGDFDPVSAGGFLSTVRFMYSLRWIHDSEGSEAGIVWGVPVSLLRAVVNSFIFSAAAALIAAVIGSAIGVGLFMVRGYRERRFPKSLEESSHLTWLNLR